MNYNEQYTLMIFNYYVIFKSDVLRHDYKPIVSPSFIDSSNSMHLFDDELVGIIPALWYILHLPRMGCDVLEQGAELVIHSYDEPHNIIPIPFDEKTKKESIKFIKNATLIICEDEIYDSLMINELNEHSVLGIKKVSELNSALLKFHWKYLSNYIHSYFVESIECIVDENYRFTTGIHRKILPLIPLANQLGKVGEILNNISEICVDNNYIKYTLWMRKRILDLFNALFEEDNIIRNKYENDLKENPIFKGIPLVITLPGIMRHQIKTMKRSNKLPNTEKEIINILGYHRAIAKNAIYLEGTEIPQEAYDLLDKIESHCKSAITKDNKFIWNSLNELGMILNNILEPFNIDIVHTISQITVFSDFPIGLAILPGCSAPLCCIKPISYRPLTPLTRAFQKEIIKQPQIYFGKKLRILIAECVKSNDPIRFECDILSEILLGMASKYEDIEIIREEISSIEQFKETLLIYDDINILLVSAHGYYDHKINMAGLIIGDKMWMADDNDVVFPPVVLLSACHVMPRGMGVVSVGDMFIRNGALAVLGTFIPVHVRRNAMLIVRLFVEIFEVRSGWSEMRTLDQIWSHVVSTNAIHEIIASSSRNLSKLERWANTPNKFGNIPQKEFKMNLSVNRLRSTHIYRDTENILQEMAYRDGIGEYFDSYIKATGYFPESIFYQFVGMPENVFIRNNIFESIYDNTNI